MESKSPRQKFLDFLGKYWWIAIILVVGLSFITDIPIFRYALYGVGIIFSFFIFAPFLIQIFAPAFSLISSLSEHFKDSKNQTAGKRYIFIPATLVAVVGFVTAQSILSIWVFILSFLIWIGVIGFFFSFITIFFFGLAPIAIITAPFVVWIKLGFLPFLSVIIFFLIATFWFGFSKLAFPSDSWESTPDDFLGYSPHTFLLGALSFQVIALPLYHFGLFNVANTISDFGGAIFLLLAFISYFKWRSIKKKLSHEEKENIYKPSVWIFIFGFILTSLLYSEFQQKYGAPTAVLFWLNSFFLVALIGRFFGIFRRKKIKAIPSENQL